MHEEIYVGVLIFLGGAGKVLWDKTFLNIQQNTWDTKVIEITNKYHK